jgi:hypothetical protein
LDSRSDPTGVKEISVPKRYMSIALAALASILPVLAKDAAFEGRWIIDKQASSANFDIPDNFTEQIKMKGNDVSVQSTWREPKNGVAPLPLLGLMVTDSKLKADGKEQRNQVGPFVQITKTNINGNEIVTEYNAGSQEGKTVSGKWVRTLSDDGRQMTLVITQTGNGPNSEGKLVFHRK